MASMMSSWPVDLETLTTSDYNADTTLSYRTSMHGDVVGIFFGLLEGVLHFTLCFVLSYLVIVLPSPSLSPPVPLDLKYQHFQLSRGFLIDVCFFARTSESFRKTLSPDSA